MPSGDGEEKVSETCTVITTLLDHEAAPADQVRDTYLTRWSASETTFGEDKTTITGAGNRTRPVLRSGSPRLVIQEAWAWLTATHLVRAGEAAALRSEHAAAARCAAAAPGRSPRTRNPSPPPASTYSAPWNPPRSRPPRHWKRSPPQPTAPLARLCTPSTSPAGSGTPARPESTPEIPARHRHQAHLRRETPGHRLRPRPLLAAHPGYRPSGRRNRPAARGRGPWNRAPDPP